MKSLFDTLNIVYGEDEKRGFVKLNAISLLFTVGGILFVVAALGAIVVIPVALASTSSCSEAADLLRRLGRWPAMFAVLRLALAVIYRYGPSCECCSALFSWYASSSGSSTRPTARWGGLSASCGFPRSSSCWAAPNSTPREHQTARDTTTGSPKPMGACGHD